MARTQNWHQKAQLEAAEQNFADAEIAPFERSLLFAAHQGRDGDYCKKWMAVRHMPQNALPTGVVLRPVRTELGDVFDADCEPTWTSRTFQKAVDKLMEGAGLIWKIEKSKTKDKATFKEEAADVGQWRSTTGTECSSLATSSCVAAAANPTGGQRFQRIGQRVQPNAGTIGSTSSSASAHVVWPWTNCWTALDAMQPSWHATDACLDAISRYDFHWSAAYAGHVYCRAHRGSAYWHEGPEEAGQDRQGSQKGREPFCRVSKPCTCRNEKRQQGVLAQSPHCGDRLGQSQRSSTRGGERQNAVMVSMARLLATVCHQVERVYGAVPSRRDCLPSPGPRCAHEPQEGSKKAGHSQEAHGCRQQRRGLCSFFRRRDGRYGLQGGDRDHKGRKCAKNPRGAQTSGDQLRSSVGIGRQTGAQGKASPQRRRGWGTALAQYAAFWEGRRCVTDVYLRQWPLAGFDLNLDARANTMHWSHSVLMEKNFLSPWQAIDQASELALEIGSPDKLKVEYIQLPKRRHFAGRIVRFQEQVQVFEGEDIENEFHTSQVPVRQGPRLPMKWHLPKEMMLGDTGSSSARDTGAHDGSGSGPDYHFLDRNLPFDTPNYIHHLQYLWRERHMRVEEGEYYRLRTWYIHHLHVRQWKRPRLVELEGDGATWHRDVLQAWRDQLHNDEVLNIAVVFPEVRAPSDRRVLPHADLILVQGGQERCGGLATVYLPDHSNEDHYTWAVSYARHLSGVEIIQGVEADQFSQTHEIRIYHDWTPIPVTLTPTHWMLNGHSFVIVVRDAQDTAGASSSAQQVHAGQDLAEAQDDPQVEQGAQLESAEEESATTDEEIPPIDQLQGVQVFGLERHPHHCFVHWLSYNTILFEVLRATGIPRDAVVGYHYFAVPLIDQHPAEEAILLQKVGDIPGGSPDRLALVDITHLAPHGDRPLQQREVYRLPRYLGRIGFLQELGIQEQCDQSDFKCVVHHNNQLWLEDDLVPRLLQHAAYFRVEIPPIVECSQHERERPAKRAHVQSPNRGETTRSSRGTALFQTGKKMRYKSPIAHSATFPSLRVVPQQTPSTSNSRTAVRQSHEQGWLPQASMTFFQCAATEYHDEGPVIHWTTWYLHHQRYHRNSESRLLRLDSLQHLWFQDLCELWSDVIDYTIPGRVHHVHPSPPADDRQVSVGHLILEQGQGELLPILMTGIFDHPTLRRLWHFAGLMPPFITRHELLEELGISR